MAVLASTLIAGGLQIATAPEASAAINNVTCGPDANYGYVYYTNGVSGTQACVRVIQSAGTGTWYFPVGSTNWTAWGIGGGGGGGGTNNSAPSCGYRGSNGQAFNFGTTGTRGPWNYTVGAGGTAGNADPATAGGTGGFSIPFGGSASAGGAGGSANYATSTPTCSSTSTAVDPYAAGNLRAQWPYIGVGGNGGLRTSGGPSSGGSGLTGGVVYYFTPGTLLAPSTVSVATASTTGSADVTWAAPADTTWLAKYTVTATSSDGGTTRTCTATKTGYTIPSTTCQIANLSTGKTYTFAVTAANALDTTSSAATSAPYVVPDPPVITVAPTISGSGGAYAVGTSIAGSDGTWTGLAPITYGYQWQACTDPTDLNTCSDVAGATSAAYTPMAAEAGTSLRLRVTATNSDGSADAFSVPSAAEQITETPVFTAQAATGAVVGSAYSYTFAASGYRVTYAVASGALPPGLSLNGTTGVVSGTPTTRGQSTFTISATNDSGSVSTISQYVAVQESQSVTINDPGTQTYSPGGTFAISGSATSSLPVTFGSSTAGVCTVAGTTVSIVTAGTCTITGDQAGNTEWVAAPQATRNVTIDKASQTVSFTYSGGAKTVGNADFSVASMASASSGLSPTFTSSTTPVCSVTSGGMVTLVAQGTCTLVADQPGDDRYLTATSTVSQSFTVNRGTTTISWAPTTALTMPESGATFAAASSLAGAVTYAVTDQGTTGCAVNSGARTITFSATGSCIVSATAAQNDQYESVSTSRTFVITKADQTVTINDPGAQTFSPSGTFGVSGTATPSALTVAFGSSTLAVCTVSGTTVTIVAAGTCTITGDQSGNGSYNAAPQATRDITIGPASTTVTWAPTTAVTTLQSPLTPSSLATVSTGGGAISYAVANAGTTGCTVDSSTGELTYTTSGSCQVTATAAATANYASSSTTVTFVITKVAQTITFGSLSNQAYGTGPYVISGTTDATGLVLAYSTSTPAVCSVTGASSLVGGATTASVSLLATGTCTIVAAQAGSDTYDAATSITQSLSISQGTQSGLNFSNASTVVFGDSLTLQTIGGSGIGAVTFAVTTGGSAGCTVNSSSGVLTYTAAGSCVVQGTKAGGGVYADVLTSLTTITVSRTPQSTTITSTVPTAPLPGDTYAVTSTSSSGLTTDLSILAGLGTVCSISGSGPAETVTFLATGTCIIYGSQFGNGNYLPADPEDTQTIEVGALNQSITFGSLADKNFGTAPFAVSATASSGLTVAFASNTSSVCTATTAGVVTLLTVGECRITASQAGNAQYAAASDVIQAFNVVAVVPFAPTLTSISAGDGSITVGYTTPSFTGGEAIAGYQAVATPSSGPAVTGPCADLSAPLACSIIGLTNGTAYTVTVAAINSVGVGAASTASSARTPAAAAMAVTDAYAVPDDGSVDLHFAAISAGGLGGGAFTRYEIYRRVAGGSWPGPPTTTITSQGSGELTQSYSGLANGTSYEFKIVVITSANAEEIAGNTTFVTEFPSTTPSAPVDLLVVAGTGTSATVSWSVPLSDGGAPITTYSVTATGGATCGTVTIDSSTQVATCTLTGLSYSTSYTVTVGAVNRMGRGTTTTASYATGADPNAGGGGSGGTSGGGTSGGSSGGSSDGGSGGTGGSGGSGGPRPPFPPSIPTPDGPTDEEAEEVVKKPSTGSISELPTLPIVQGTGPMPGGTGEPGAGVRSRIEGVKIMSTASPELAAAMAAGAKVVMASGSSQLGYMTSRKITVAPGTMLQIIGALDPDNQRVEFRLWMQDRTGAWFRMGNASSVDGQVVFPVMQFDTPGTYQIIATSVSGPSAVDASGNPVFGSTTIRTVVLVTPRQELGSKICPNMIAFDKRSAALSKKSKRQIRALAECLGAMPAIKVSGYVAQAIRPAAAQQMAYLRARNVRNYLRELGYDGGAKIRTSIELRPAACEPTNNRCALVRLELGNERASERSAWELVSAPQVYGDSDSVESGQAGTGPPVEGAGGQAIAAGVDSIGLDQMQLPTSGST